MLFRDVACLSFAAILMSITLPVQGHSVDVGTGSIQEASGRSSRYHGVVADVVSGAKAWEYYTMRMLKSGHSISNS